MTTPSSAFRATLRRQASAIQAVDANAAMNVPVGELLDLLDEAAAAPGLTGAIAYAAQVAHYSSWNSNHQEGHTNPSWLECTAWPCAILAAEVRR